MDTIRVMFYDKSKWAGEVLSSTWFAGGRLYKTFRSLDFCIGVDCWEDAFDWLLSVEKDKKISMIQFWGHGSPGNIFINNEQINTGIIRKDNVYHERALKLKDRLSDDAVIWLRSCGVFAGPSGHYFAKRWAKFFDCTIAGHTFIVGPFQSGLHTIKPNEEPTWDLKEGFDKQGNLLISKLWSPNTIFCLRGDIPKGW